MILILMMLLLLLNNERRIVTRSSRCSIRGFKCGIISCSATTTSAGTRGGGKSSGITIPCITLVSLHGRNELWTACMTVSINVAESCFIGSIAAVLVNSAAHYWRRS